MQIVDFEVNFSPTLTTMILSRIISSEIYNGKQMIPFLPKPVKFEWEKLETSTLVLIDAG